MTENENIILLIEELTEQFNTPAEIMEIIKERYPNSNFTITDILIYCGEYLKRRLGARRVENPERKLMAYKLLERGLDIKEAASEMEISTASLYRFRHEWEKLRSKPKRSISYAYRRNSNMSFAVSSGVTFGINTRHDTIWKD